MQRRKLWRLQAVVAFGLLLPVPLTGAAFVASPPSSNSPSSGVVADRVVQDSRVTEASGLAVSLRHPSVLWAHNDSGHPAQLFAIGPDGRTVATVRIGGVPAVDWEAMAIYRDRSGRSMIAVADIGDNEAARASVSVVVLPEPAVLDVTVRPERVIHLRYPTGPVDAEALLVDPDGSRAFIVTKGFWSTVYEVPPSAWTAPAGQASVSGARSRTATLVSRSRVPLMLVTDGVMGPGGHPLLRTYRELAVLPPIGDGPAASRQTGDAERGDVERGGQPLAVVRLPEQQQGEGLALRDRRTVLAGSEGVGQPVLRVPLPDDAAAALGSPPASSAAGASSGRFRPRATPVGSRTGNGRTPSWLFPVLGGVTGAAAACALAALGRHRRRPLVW